MAEPNKRPRETGDPEEAEMARSDFGKYRHGEKAPPYGTTKERKKRPELDPKHNYGGRTERPDPDVNDTPHVEEDEDKDKDETDRRALPAGAVYSSPLPPSAFGEGDLFADHAETRAAKARGERSPFLRALLARFAGRRSQRGGAA